MLESFKTSENGFWVFGAEVSDINLKRYEILNSIALDIGYWQAVNSNRTNFKLNSGRSVLCYKVFSPG